MSNRIETTHTGSLPRPDELIKLMWAVSDGIPVDAKALDESIVAAVDSVFGRQADSGITYLNDGEMSKPSYATYVKDRLSGFDGEAVESYFFKDLEEFPRSKEVVAANPGRRKRYAPACTGEISVSDPDAALLDMANLNKAAADRGVSTIFSSAASPGVVSIFFENQYYDSDEAYVFAIAEAMRHEYEAIAASGAKVQLDCPDLAMGRHSTYANLSLEDYRKRMGMNIAALNHAVRNIPEEQLRMHLCWGNYPGPHHCDVALAEIIDLVWDAKPRTILFEAANPRHAHEWTIFEDTRVPSNKILCPGVIECQSNYVEHPELVAQRIVRYGKLIDPSQLMAGVDCGFSVHVGMQGVDPDVAFAKLAALAQGAEIASKKLF